MTHDPATGYRQPAPPEPTAPPVLLKLSEVRRATGIAVESLGLLIEDQVVRGVERARNGHVYLVEHQVPTYEQLVALLDQQLRRHLKRASPKAEDKQAAKEICAVCPIERSCPAAGRVKTIEYS